LVKGLKRAGKTPTRESLVDGMENIGTMDLGGFKVSFGPNDHQASGFVDLTIIGKGGTFRR
jgi:branched-chain amino acid transport system substrate-binding protein